MKFAEVCVECVLSVVFAILTREGKKEDRERKTKGIKKKDNNKETR